MPPKYSHTPLWSMSALADVIQHRGRLDEAETLSKELLNLLIATLGEEHPETLSAMNKLAVVLWKEGKLGEVEDINRRNLRTRQLLHGQKDPRTLWADANLQDVLEQRTGAAASDDGDFAPDPHQTTVLAYESFEDELSLDWEIQNHDASHVSLTKVPGALTITTQNGDFWRSNKDYENLFLVDCPPTPDGDLQVTTCISSFVPKADWNQAGLTLYDDDDNYLKFVYEWNDRCGGPILSVGIETEGTLVHAAFRARGASEKVWLSITKRGNWFTFSASLDGQTFFPVRYPFRDTSGLLQRGALYGDGSLKRVGLLAINGIGVLAPEIDACFEYFEVRSISDQEAGELREGGGHAESQ